MNRQQNFYSEFSVPGDIFLLGLNSGELAVYTFLLRCENRRTHQCWPSYKTIGRAAGMSVNTVRKHICSLADRGLIRTENTSVTTKQGAKRNGNLLYTILPIEPIVKERIQSQVRQSRPQHSATEGRSA